MVIGMVEIRVLRTKPVAAMDCKAWEGKIDSEYVGLIESFAREFSIEKFITALLNYTRSTWEAKPHISYVGAYPVMQWYLLVNVGREIPVVVELDNANMKLIPHTPYTVPLEERKNAIKMLIYELLKYV